MAFEAVFLTALVALAAAFFAVFTGAFLAASTTWLACTNQDSTFYISSRWVTRKDFILYICKAGALFRTPFWLSAPGRVDLGEILMCPSRSGSLNASQRCASAALSPFLTE